MLDQNLILPQLLGELAVSHADQPAIIDVTGPRVTYAELHENALVWADALRRVGVGAGDTVVTMLPNSFDGYYSWLGAAWLQALEVPANNMYRGTMLKYLLQNSDASVLVIAERFLDRLAEIAPELDRLKTVVVPDASAALPELPFAVITGEDFKRDAVAATGLPGPVDSDTMAIIYTSGTTGPSKGVLVPWGELYWFATGMPADLIEEGDNYYSPYPVFHLSGKSALYQTAVARATLVIRETFSVTEFWNDIRTHGVRSLALLGPLAMILLSMPEQPNDADNPADRMAIGPIIPNIEQFKKRFGIERHTSGFGMTEIGMPVNAGWNPPQTGTCGKQREGRPGYEVRIVDDAGQPVPTGQIGELVVRAAEPHVMNAGYWKMSEATERAWRDGWFHTGDAFRMDDDGWLYFVDRVKDALRRRGENISSFEVEACINQYPAVQESAVVGYPSEFGEDDVKAFVVITPDTEFDPAELFEFLETRLPKFMLPRYIEVISELPKTEATFRTQKVKLRELGNSERTWDRLAVS